MSSIPDQHIRQQALDIKQSIIVQAPAGSGKTELLTQRFLALLGQAVTQPEQIVAITFTRKAAQEMRARIINTVELAMSDAQPESAHKAFTISLARQVLAQDQKYQWQLVANPSRLKIMTIDALAASIAYQKPILSGLGALPEVSEQPEKLYQFTAEQIAKLHNDPSSELQPHIRYLLAHLDNDYQNLIRLLAELLPNREQWLGDMLQLSTSSDPGLWLQEQFEAYAHQVLAGCNKYFDPHISARIITLWNSVADNWQQEYWDGLPEPDLTALEQWQLLANWLCTSTGSVRKSPTKAQGLIAPSQIKDKDLKAQAKEAKAEMLELLSWVREKPELANYLARIQSLTANLYHYQDIEFLRHLAPVVLQLVAQLKLTFQQQNQADFSEILSAANLALSDETNPSRVQLKLESQLQHLLIDEFQDTSLQQFEFLENLLKPWSYSEANRSLFIVGDPMQSIYSFRQAKVSLFLYAQQYGLAGIKLTNLNLQANFRSAPELVQTFNRCFNKLLPSSADLASGAIPFNPAVAIQERSCDPVQCYLATSDAHEAQWVVELIEHCANDGPDHSIAILVRARTHLLAILPALKAANIAFEATGVERLFSKQQSLDLWSLTQALIDPLDRIALLSLLRSPFIGLTLSELELLTQSQHEYLFAAMADEQVLKQLTAHGQQAVHRLLQTFATIQQQNFRVSPALLWRNCWAQLGGDLLYAKSHELELTERFFAELDLYWQKHNYWDPELFLEALDAISIDQSATDAQVKIMTIHKAKGLEFDSVIIPGMAKRASADRSALVTSQDMLTASGRLVIFAAHKAGTQQQNFSLDFVRQELAAERSYEALRLLYVACTRAKSRLLLTAVGQDQPKKKFAPVTGSLLGLLWPCISAEFIELLPLTATTDSSITQQQQFKRIRVADLPELTLRPACYSLEQLNRPEAPNFAANIARAVGVVVHEILFVIAKFGWQQFLEQPLDQYMPGWQRRLAQLIAPEFVASTSEKIYTIINKVIDSEIAKFILTADEAAEAEYEIIFISKRRNIARQSVTAECRQNYSEGSDPNFVATLKIEKRIIDRCFIFKGTRYIIDYKIIGATAPLDQSASAELLEFHGAQLKRYAAWFEQHENLPIKTHLYLPETDQLL